MSPLLGADFEREAQVCTKRRRPFNPQEFKAFFGVYPIIAASLWRKLERTNALPQNSQPKHLLWMLAFLKIYSKEPIMAALFFTNVRTFRDKVWEMMREVHYLEIIIPENRFMNSAGGRIFMTVDGTDFRIREPQPFDPKWYSHKYHKAGLRYEVGICIRTGWICWINGPYAAGSWSDQRIALDELVYVLLRDEKVVADGTYGGRWFVTPDNGRRGQPIERLRAIARARHEATNKYFKDFGAMKEIWRHPWRKHGIAFGAIANIVQIRIEKEGPPFTV